MVSFAIFATGVLAFECARNSLTSDLLYSRRTAELLVKALDGQLDRTQRSRIAMLCLSEAVAEPLMAAHFNRISLADYPSDESMMALALAVTREQNRP